MMLEHLVAEHPGVQTPWFTGSGWIERVGADALERLHNELHRQGEEHEGERRGDEPIELRPSVCRRTRCGAVAARADGLCVDHGAEYDAFGRRRSA